MKHHILCLAAALALAAWPAGAPLAQVRLPSLGDSTSEDFAVGDERRLGEQIMREVRRDPAYLDDPLLADYLQSLWGPLVAAARQRGDIGPDSDSVFAWQAFLVRDRSVNAFALPGGYVGVHLGLIAMTLRRDELASVLAHELSHVTQRHIARSMANAQRQGVVGLAAMILGVIAASRSGNADMAQAAVVGGQAAMAQGQLNYSRDMEREADRIGFGVLTAAGFAPDGMPAMFERLGQASRLTDSNAYPYLRSHPLTVERLGEARARVEALHAPAPAPVNVVEHALMQARARVLMDPAVTALQRQAASVAPPDAMPLERAAAAYARALAALQLGDGAGATRAIEALRAMLATSPLRDARDARAGLVVAALEADVRLAQGDAAGAVALIDAAGGGRRPAMLLRAEAAMQAARQDATTPALRASVEALQAWVSEHRDDATAWATLSRAAGQAGLRLRAVHAEAESRAAMGDLPGAIDRLQAAQRLGRGTGPGDLVDQSVIDSRLRELMHQRRQQLAELRGERGAGAPWR